MLRRLLCGIVAALALAPVATASGGGPSPGVSQGWDGVTAPGLGVRYVTLTTGANTSLAVIRKSDGRVVNFTSLTGSWGIPLVALDGSTSGLSTDRRTLVLGDTSSVSSPNALRTTSSFLVLNTKQLQAQGPPITLDGDFSFDALSPDGRMLYLIQHVLAADLTRYVVRAFDLSTNRLLPRTIADRTQRGWVMHGYAVTRATSADGRWAYTLYRNDGGYPFIHALDTVSATAHCIGIPWKGTQDNLFYVRLSLRDSGRSLLIHWRDGTPVATMDTRTFRLSRATGGGGSFPWWTLAAPAALLIAATLLVPLVRRQRAVEVLPT